MDTLSDTAGTGPPPLSAAGLAAERLELARHIGIMPDSGGAGYARSLLLLFIAPWGYRRKACLPFGTEGPPDPDEVAFLCGFIVRLMARPLRHETAIIVLRRQGPAEITETDEFIFQTMCWAIEGHQTSPWSFYVTGPGGAREMTAQP